MLETPRQQQITLYEMIGQYDVMKLNKVTDIVCQVIGTILHQHRSRHSNIDNLVRACIRIRLLAWIYNRSRDELMVHCS